MRASALHGTSLRAARDGADGVIEKMREAWLRQQEADAEMLDDQSAR